MVRQVDAVPQGWTYPTDWWDANEIITDRLSIQVDDLAPGRYELWLGFYNEESGERLPLATRGDSSLIVEGEAVLIHELE